MKKICITFDYLKNTLNMETALHSTTDYSIFRDFNSNREVNETHVRRLVRSITSKDLLKLNPISVNEEMYIIDGQHRLEAARRLGKPVYYVIGEGVTAEDIRMLNTGQKNWNTMDYINFYTIRKRSGFMELSRFINQHPGFHVSSVLSLVNSTDRRSGVELKEGIIDISDIGVAENVCSFCSHLKTVFGYDFVYDSRFPVAMKKAFKTESFDSDILLGKISAAPRSFVPCHTVKDYCHMIEEIYNYKLSKNKISISLK